MAYGQNFATFQNGVGAVNTGRNLYNAGNWAANTAYPWMQGQLAGGAGAAGEGATAAAGTEAASGAATGAEAAAGATTAAETAGIWESALAALEAAGLAFSDKRLKENIRKVGLLDNGLPVYAFNLLGGPTQIGLLAQEVRKVAPDAVSKGPRGLLMVDYDLAVEKGKR